MHFSLTMQIIPETNADIAILTAAHFPGFGSGKAVLGNPVASATAQDPPTFAAGVSVQEVVDFVAPMAQSIGPEAQLLRELLHELEPLNLPWSNLRAMARKRLKLPAESTQPPP